VLRNLRDRLEVKAALHEAEAASAAAALERAAAALGREAAAARIAGALAAAPAGPPAKRAAALRAALVAALETIDVCRPRWEIPRAPHHRAPGRADDARPRAAEPSLLGEISKG